MLKFSKISICQYFSRINKTFCLFPTYHNLIIGLNMEMLLSAKKKSSTSCRTRALVGGESGVHGPPLFEGKKDDIFFGDHTDKHIQKKIWNSQFQNADEGPVQNHLARNNCSMIMWFEPQGLRSKAKQRGQSAATHGTGGG